MEKKIKNFCYTSKKKFLVWKKKSNDFVTFRKKNFGYGKKIKRFCYFSKKKFWVWKKFFFKNALHKLNIDQTFLLHFKKKKTVIWYACITLNARSHSLIISFTLKSDFQVPYNINITFTQNVLFFSENVIFDKFSIKRFVLFILAFYNFFYKWVPKLKIT
jgi:hypothetical protein